MVLHSTENSINNNEISFIAILEVIIATLIYWGIAIYYDFYVHIITSVFLAPFLLLKSKDSIFYALNRVSIVFSRISFSILKFSEKIYLVSTFICTFFVLYFLGDISSPVYFFIIFIGGAILSNIVQILFFALYAKIFATIKYFSSGIRNIGLNWYSNCFVIDLFKIPEIIPGIEKDERILDDLKFSYFFKKIKHDSYLNIFLRSILLGALYLITIFYRFSIKSTFWFYIPLLFLVKTPSSIDANSNIIGYFYSSLYETHFAKLRFYVDFSSLEMWKILQISIAILTIIIFFWANGVRTPKVNNEILLEKDFNFMSIFYLNILRNWISFFYFSSAFIYLSFYYNFWENSFIPSGIKSLFIQLKEIILITPFS